MIQSMLIQTLECKKNGSKTSSSFRNSICKTRNKGFETFSDFKVHNSRIIHVPLLVISFESSQLHKAGEFYPIHFFLRNKVLPFLMLPSGKINIDNSDSNFRPCRSGILA